MIKFGENGIGTSFLLHGFVRVGIESSRSSIMKIWQNTLLPWGPQMLLAFAGLAVYLLDLRKRLDSERVGRSILDSMCLWLVLAGPALVVTSGFIGYVYVLAMPTALLAAVTLSKIRLHYALPLVFIMALAQFYFVTDDNFRSKHDEKRRILAAACFLIEQRPDLLEPGKKPFASGANPMAWNGNAGAVTSYMRGRSKALVIPYEFPATRFGSLNPALYNAFVDTYKKDGKILANWMILGSRPCPTRTLDGISFGSS